VRFLRHKWARELDYRLMKELWCFTGNHISVRFVYESYDASGQWWRSHTYPRFATRLRVSAALGQEPEVEVALVYRLRTRALHNTTACKRRSRKFAGRQCLQRSLAEGPS
jgi:hypothetical protein